MIRLRSLFTNSQGTVLLEVLGAIVILAIIGLLFVSFAEGIRMVATSKNKNQAIDLAQEKIEELKELEFSEINTNSGHYNDHPSLGGKQFNREVRVEPAPYASYPSSINEVKRITVTVSWDNGARSTSLVCDRCKE